MLVGRTVSLLIVLAGVLFAFLMPSLIDGLKAWLKIPALLGIAFWLGLFWRRYNAAGAWASFIASAAGWYITANHTGLSEPWQIVTYLGCALLAGIVVSLLTRPPDTEFIERFHHLIATPIAEGEEITESCHLPAGVQPAERPTLFTGTSFEFPRPSRTSVVGFALSWLAVALIIIGFVSLF